MPSKNNSVNELGLTWVTEPPIRVLNTPEEIKAAVEALQNNLVGWGRVGEPTPPAASDFDRRDWKSPKRTQQERWNVRVGDMEHFPWSVIKFAQPPDFHVVAYRVAGAPIGLMAMSDMLATPTVNGLVTHPGSENAGGILIEYAVQKSDEWGKGGKLQLTPDNKECEQAYKHLGFEGTPYSMTLDPASRRDIWSRPGGKWRLTKFIGMKYVG
jgi:hypothetical protein